MMNFVLPLLIFAGLGLIAGVLLTAISKAFAVKTDERLEAVQNALPQVNCGACGFSGCNAYADAIVNQGAEINKCNPGGKETANKISEIMGKDAGNIQPVSAFVHCRGTCDAAPSKFEFDGVNSCAAANRFYGGTKQCKNGCLGLGDCLSVCSEGAISICNGVAVINEELCKGCGLCAKACPKNLISIRRKNQRTDVVCKSEAHAKVTKKLCKNGCVGCKLCEKACPSGAMKVENNFASIDYDKCLNCGACADACKLGVIRLAK